MDDGVLCEPALGVRPWLSEAAYLEGMRRCLGPKALNEKKDALEGQFSVRQLVWGLEYDTEAGTVAIPER
eukprot:825555-Alexandrium_andersonii.AAC.1